ncbi:hypothetical protein AMJ86_00840 [bacterium SM23_57]|nr:MAG: hypothetical protein AMJ86_00840 [bacterium SM23_57]
MKFPALTLACRKFGQSVQKDARNNLSKKQAIASNNLSNSITFKVIEYSGGVEVDINAEFYGAFVDQGVKGHGRGNWKPYRPKRQQAPNSPFSFKSWGPPPDVFRNWIRLKGIQPRNPKTGKFMSEKSSAFLMARSAGRFGLKPTNFMTDSLKKNLPEFRQAIGIAIHRDVQTFMNREIFKLKKTA